MTTPTTAASRAVLRIALLLFLALTAALGTAGAAWAHASLVRAEPADGVTLPSAPGSFSLTFSEPVSPLVLTLVRPGGEVVPLDQVRLRDTSLEIGAPDALGNGTHVLSWRVVSEDGHPVGGSVVFSIGTAGAAPAPAGAVDWPLRTAIWGGKLLLYAALFLGIGGAVFRSWIGPPSQGALRLMCGAMALGLPAVPLSVGLQGLDALGAPFARLRDPVVWQAGFGTSYGSTALLAAAGLCAGLLSCAVRGMAGRALSLAALACAGLALAASGHAGAAPPQWLSRPAVFLHAVGIAFWAGALLPLGQALRVTEGADARRLLCHFSRAIPFAFAPLLAAGLLLAVLQLRAPEDLWTTAYGRVLAAKLALAGMLLLLAGWNRFRLTGRVDRGERRAVRLLRRSIMAETFLVLVLFGVAALWRFTPPPRALAETSATAAPARTIVHIHGGKAMADLSVTPARVGPAEVSIWVTDADSMPLAAKAVTLVLSNPAAGVQPIRRPAAAAGDGVWRIDGLAIPLAGSWSVRIDILVSDFELVKLGGQLDIGP